MYMIGISAAFSKIKGLDSLLCPDVDELWSTVMRILRRVCPCASLHMSLRLSHTNPGRTHW